MKSYVREKSQVCMLLFGYGFVEPFVAAQKPKPILFTKDPERIDLSGVPDPSFFMEIGPDRFLLHPGPATRPITSVRFKDLPVGDARLLLARVTTENDMSGDTDAGSRFSAMARRPFKPFGSAAGVAMRP